MEITYDKETDSKYVQIKKGVVASTTEESDWLFFDYDKKGEVIGVEILDSSAHPINISVIANTFMGYSPIEKAVPLKTIKENASHLIEELSAASIKEVELIS